MEMLDSESSDSDLFPSTSNLFSDNEEESGDASQCGECGKKFPSFSAMYIHQAYSHNINSRKTNYKQHNDPFDEIYNSLQKDKATEKAPSEGAVKECNFCKSVIKSQSYHFGKSRVCKQCGVQSPCAKINQEHEILCKAAAQGDIVHYQCNTCKQWFRSMGYLRRHQKMRVCSECNVNFYCTKMYQDHDKNENSRPRRSEGKPFQCDACKQWFTSIGYLRRHQKMRVCKECELPFYCTKLFKDHENCENDDGEIATNVHVETPKKVQPVAAVVVEERKCNFCGEICSEEEDPDWHARPTRCPRCSYLQPCTSLMAKHLKVCRFSEENVSFSCPFCRITFSGAALLGTHIQLECGSKFWCRECNQAYSEKDKLEKHNSVHHSMNVSVKLENFD